MYCVKLNHSIKSRHAHGPAHLFFVADPFPAYAALGAPTQKPVDNLVAYCFKHGQIGELDTLYNSDGTIMEAIQDILNAEELSMP